MTTTLALLDVGAEATGAIETLTNTVLGALLFLAVVVVGWLLYRQDRKDKEHEKAVADKDKEIKELNGLRVKDAHKFAEGQLDIYKDNLEVVNGVKNELHLVRKVIEARFGVSASNGG